MKTTNNAQNAIVDVNAKQEIDRKEQMVNRIIQHSQNGKGLYEMYD